MTMQLTELIEARSADSCHLRLHGQLIVKHHDEICDGRVELND